MLLFDVFNEKQDQTNMIISLKIAACTCEFVLKMIVMKWEIIRRYKNILNN